jgi:CheY-like chemotaxis protein
MVLVVEDEDAIRLGAVTALRRSGLSVVEAADGTTALDLLRQHGPAIRLILLDIRIPGATSWEVFDEARRLNGEIKVVVTSAYGPETANECFPGMRIDAFLVKPYRLLELTGLVSSILGVRANP